MKKRVFLISFLLIMFWTGVVSANTKVVLFVMDGVNLQELEQGSASNYQRLLKRGAVGLMNARTAGGLEPIDTYLTIGSGNRACGGFEGRLSFNVNEYFQGIAVKDIYQRRIRELDNSAAIVNLSLAQLKKDNQHSAYHAKVGQLGDSLADNGLKIAVLGNADTKQNYRRQIALLGINKYGIINQGDIGHQLSKMVSQYPSSYLTNKGYLLTELNNYLDRSDLVIIESGATSRIEAVKDKLVPAKFKVAKQDAINRADDLLGAVVEKLDFESDYLIILSPTPAKNYIKRGYKLSWALVLGPDIEQGLLTSGTTKQTGLISNLDILPTIYSYLLANKQKKFTGQKITSIASKNNIDYLNELNYKIKTIFSWRGVVVKQFIVLQIIILLVTGLTLIFKKKTPKIKQLIIYAVLTVNWLPFFFIFSRYFTSFSLTFSILIWLISSFIIAYYTFRLNLLNGFFAVLLPNFLISSSLIIDLWTGGKLLKVSILGYSPVIGARYYGIGNEYMGLLIGTTIVITAIFFEIKEEVYKSILLFSSLVLIITIGAPNLGSNFGGLISSSFTCALTYFYLNKYNLNLKALAKVLAVVIIIVTIILIIDIYTGAQSHVARVILKIRDSGIQELFRIIQRKLAINLRLLQWTIWTKVLLAFVFILVILFKNPRGLTASLVTSYPYFSAAFKALLWGGLVAGMVNDSGVVVVATLLLIPVFTLVYIIFLQIKPEEEGNKC